MHFGSSTVILFAFILAGVQAASGADGGRVNLSDPLVAALTNTGVVIPWPGTGS